MTKLDDFLNKEGSVKSVHSSAPLPQWLHDEIEKVNMATLPQWAKDLMPNQEKADLIKGFVDGRMTALSVGNKEMLDAFAAKQGFEYSSAKNNMLINNLDKNRDR